MKFPREPSFYGISAIAIGIFYVNRGFLGPLLIGCTLLFLPSILLFKHGKKRGNPYHWSLYVILIVGGFFARPLFWEVAGGTHPGALFEKPQYSDWVYVKASPSFEGAHYHAPGFIKAYAETDDEGNFGRQYRVERIQLPNGRFVWFDDNNTVETGGYSSTTDRQGRSWRMMLTEDAVSSAEKKALRLKR